MRKSGISKTIASNRARKTMPGMKAMPGMGAKVRARGRANPMAAPEPMMPSNMGMGMRKGGSAKKPKVGIAIMIAVGKKGKK